MTTTTCTVCELHAESTFKIEGMDCHEEVAILEKRLKKLTGLQARAADVLRQSHFAARGVEPGPDRHRTLAGDVEAA